jgi:hypothetical protein
MTTSKDYARQRRAEIAAAIKKAARVKHHVINNTFPYYEGNGIIHAPAGGNAEELYILAHECGHAAHRHRYSAKLRWKHEYEAEIWAHDILRRYGVAVTKAQTRRAKANVRDQFSMAWDFRDKRTARAAANWCGCNIPKDLRK